MIYDTSNQYDRQNAISKVKSLLDKKAVIEVIEKREIRTIKQNAYLHVVFSLFALNFGYTLSESKHLLKASCDFMIYEKKKRMFVKSTSMMSKKDIGEFIEWIRNVSAKQGYYIPTADEYIKEQTRFNREIQQNKEYL